MTASAQSAFQWCYSFLPIDLSNPLPEFCQDPLSPWEILGSIWPLDIAFLENLQIPALVHQGEGTPPQHQHPLCLHGENQKESSSLSQTLYDQKPNIMLFTRTFIFVKYTHHNKSFSSFILVCSPVLPPCPNQNHGLRNDSCKHSQANHQEQDLKKSDRIQITFLMIHKLWPTFQWALLGRYPHTQQ